LSPKDIQLLLHSYATPLGYNETTEGYGIITKTHCFPTQSPLSAYITTQQQSEQQLLVLNLSIPKIKTSINYSVHFYPITNSNEDNTLIINQTTTEKNTMIQLPVSNRPTDYYIIEVVFTYNNVDTCVKHIVYLQNNDQQLILFPLNITENESFTFQINNNLTTAHNAITIFYIPYRTIQCHIGFTAIFSVPHLGFLHKNTCQGILITLFLSRPLHIEKNIITIEKSEIN
jgi:hypothetical protein